MSTPVPSDKLPIMVSADSLVRELSLLPHPEGGFYRETHRSRGVLPADALRERGFSGARNDVTSIFYLLRAGDLSRFHRLRSDEIWNFHLGGPLRIIEIEPMGRGRIRETVLGPDVRKGHLLQHVVPAGNWFGSIPEPGTQFALVGCTVAPGFDFSDFELGRSQALSERFPDAVEWIRRLLPDR